MKVKDLISMISNFPDAEINTKVYFQKTVKDDVFNEAKIIYELTDEPDISGISYGTNTNGDICTITLNLETDNE